MQNPSPIDYRNLLVSLTFDDGVADNYSIRADLSGNNLRATWYIISGFVGTPGYLTASQLQELAAEGHEIGSHTVDHVNLIETRGADLSYEICQSRVDLMQMGFKVASFAYPFGHFDSAARQAAIDCGYNSARTVIDGPELIPPADPFTLRSMPYIVKDTRIPKMQRYITEAVAGGGGWVIFIFHHVCPACDQYAIEPTAFSDFADWLGEQQQMGLVVKTVGEVIGGSLQPPVQP
jgi:peptidoglycan/xylan/chitin deacetylase (PgdA/CDA1 family)